MHEAPIAQSLLDTALASVPHPGMRITSLIVVLGPFSGVDAECLRFYLSELSRGTCADGAELVIRSGPARLVCGSCANVVLCESGSSIEFACPKCGGPNKVEGGRELYLDSIDVQVD